jgi:hypothetical protein
MCALFMMQMRHIELRRSLYYSLYTTLSITNDHVPHATTDRDSFWWRDVLKLCDLFRGIAKCNIGDGSTVFLWLSS